MMRPEFFSDCIEIYRKLTGGKIGNCLENFLMCFPIETLWFENIENCYNSLLFEHNCTKNSLLHVVCLRRYFTKIGQCGYSWPLAISLFCHQCYISDL